MLKRILVTILTALLCVSCSDGGKIVDPDPNEDNSNSISLLFNKPASLNDLVVSCEAIVSAPDMDTIFTELTVTDSTVYGTIENIPAGQNRKFEINCYDASGTLTYNGSDVIHVFAGSVQTINIVLFPVNITGTVLIVGTFSDYPPTEEIIVFQADYQGTYDIYAMSPYATNIRQLTNSGLNDIYPKISPDRSQIIFLRHENDYARPYLMNIDGSNQSELSFLPGLRIGYCDWSTDGTKLILNANEDGDSDIFIYDFQTNEAVKIFNSNFSDALPNWSPNGEKVTFSSNMSGKYRSYTMNVDGSNLQLLIDRTDTEEKAPRYSPDGNYIVQYGRNLYAQWGIFLVNSDGTNFFEVTNTPWVDEYMPSWSPNGEKLIFKRRDSGPNGLGLYTINPDGTNQQVLLDTEFNELHAHWR